MSKGDLTVSVQYVKGVGAKRASLFARLGIFTVEQLLHFYPRAYEDRSVIKKISEVNAGETVCVRGTCVMPVNKFVSRKSGITVYSTAVSDGTDTLEITIFNNKYSAGKLEYGQDYIIFGKIEGNYGIKKTVNPSIEASSAETGIRPIYPQTAGLTSSVIAKAVKNALAFTEDAEEPFTPGLMEAFSLISEVEALKNIHFPESPEMLKRARERLIFEELFYLQLGLLGMKRSTEESVSPCLKDDYSKDFEALLPYELTGAQRRVIAEGVADLKAKKPMSRLVQGDVGSGKTAVAMSFMYSMAKNGFQCALMVPTEILAEQHFSKIKPFFEKEGIDVVLLTGSLGASKKRAVKEEIADGKAKIIIGTHALIQKDVSFKNLGLIIADEQHRFGVKQRTALAEKGENVNVCVMSATPIPRTLALFIYGELDISVIDEMPAGRQQIETFTVNSSYRERLYNFIKSNIDEGRQAYIVCPLIEESESELLSASEYAESLKSTVLKGCKIELLHGKMKPSEKENVMRSFSAGKAQIIVATTVIEVGIDVPNANVMMIENADRYGLSQLHQLRGRIGRGPYKSYCILVSDNESESSLNRLKIMKETSDGFKIADADLKLRGPGDFFGERQHGLINLRIASLLDDMNTLKITGDTARKILSADPLLKSKKYAGIKRGVDNFFASQNIAVN